MGVLDFIRGSALSAGGVSDMLNPRVWLQSAFGGGGPTAAGITIGPNEAVGLDGYFACLRAIMEDVGGLPKVLQRLTQKGKARERVRTAPANLLRRPNPYMSGQAFVESLTGQALSHGGGFAEIQRSASGDPVALWPIHADFVTVHKDEQGVYFRVLGFNGNPTVIVPWEDMLHVHGAGPNGYEGWSIAQLAREDLALAKARKIYSGSFYRNRTQVGGVIEYAKRLDAEKITSLRSSWVETYGTPGNAWKPVILESGMKYTPTAIPPKDAEYVDSERFGVVVMCRWFRMPPHKVASLDRATFSNIEHQGIEYVQDCLTPWVLRWEAELEAKLLGDPEGTGNLRVRFVLQGKLRGDYPTRTAGYRTLISTGVMTPNEARALEDLPPGLLPDGTPDPAADLLWMQGAMQPISRLAEEPPEPEPSPAPGDDGDPPDEGEEDPAEGNPPPPPPQEDAEAAARLELDVHGQLAQAMLRDGCSRARRREAIAYERARSRVGEDFGEFGAWLDKFAARQRSWVVEALEPVVSVLEVTVRAMGFEWTGLPPAQLLGAFAERWERELRVGAVAAFQGGGVWPAADTVDADAERLLGDLKAHLRWELSDAA